MTKQLEQAFEAVRKLPAERQNELAEALEAAADMAPRSYTNDQLAALDEGIADADAGRFVSDTDLAKLFAKYRGA
jgi:predicted transcriptional regulator